MNSGRQFGTIRPGRLVFPDQRDRPDRQDPALAEDYKSKYELD
jgi:hypothetical protein